MLSFDITFFYIYDFVGRKFQQNSFVQKIIFILIHHNSSKIKMYQNCIMINRAKNNNFDFHFIHAYSSKFKA